MIMMPLCRSTRGRVCLQSTSHRLTKTICYLHRYNTVIGTGQKGNGRKRRSILSICIADSHARNNLPAYAPLQFKMPLNSHAVSNQIFRHAFPDSCSYLNLHALYLLQDTLLKTSQIPPSSWYSAFPPFPSRVKTKAITPPRTQQQDIPSHAAASPPSARDRFSD